MHTNTRCNSILDVFALAFAFLVLTLAIVAFLVFALAMLALLGLTLAMLALLGLTLAMLALVVLWRNRRCGIAAGNGVGIDRGCGFAVGTGVGIGVGIDRGRGIAVGTGVGMDRADGPCGPGGVHVLIHIVPAEDGGPMPGYEPPWHWALTRLCNNRHPRSNGITPSHACKSREET